MKRKEKNDNFINNLFRKKLYFLYYFIYRKIAKVRTTTTRIRWKRKQKRNRKYSCRRHNRRCEPISVDNWILVSHFDGMRLSNDLRLLQFDRLTHSQFYFYSYACTLLMMMTKWKWKKKTSTQSRTCHPSVKSIFFFSFSSVGGRHFNNSVALFWVQHQTNILYLL